MAFMLYRRRGGILSPTGEGFSLAGYNLIHEGWVRRGRPINAGWRIGADELIKLRTGDTESISTRALLIDYHPSARWRIGVIELLEIYAFTYGEGETQPIWSPLMLRLRDIFNKGYDPEINDSQKEAVIAKLSDPQGGEDFVEFLYLTGPWGWGRNGMTNAAFLHGPARAYFKPFF